MDDMEVAVARMNKALGPGVLETRCVRYLSTLTDPTQRASIGVQLFGKRYARDTAPLCPAFEYDD